MTNKYRVRKKLAQLHTPKSFSNLPWAVQDGIQQSPIERVSAPRKAVSSPGAQEPDLWRELCSLQMGLALLSWRLCLWLWGQQQTMGILDVGYSSSWRRFAGYPSMHDGYQETGSVACCYGVLYHCVHCICKSLFRRFVHSIHLILAHAHLGSHPCIYATVFPRLVRYIPHVRKAQEEDLKGSKIIQAEYGKIESLERNHVSSISTAHSNIGYLGLSPHSRGQSFSSPTTSGNPLGNNLALYLTNSCELSIMPLNCPHEHW